MKDYQVVKNDDFDEFNKEVAGLAKEGWVPLGAAFTFIAKVISYSDDKHNVVYFCQTMIRI